jgi:tetratricopeptide (TPR) repeat protein
MHLNSIEGTTRCGALRITRIEVLTGDIDDRLPRLLADSARQATEFFHQRHWETAADAFQRCEAASPGKTDALLYRDKSLVNLGSFIEASTALESYLSVHPESDDALYLLGYVRFRQDRPKDSLALLSQAAKLKNPTAGDLRIAALDYVLLNDYTSAARYLEQSLQMDPSDLEARYHLGRVRYQQNQFAAAIVAFQEVLRNNPRGRQGGRQSWVVSRSQEP